MGGLPACEYSWLSSLLTARDFSQERTLSLNGRNSKREPVKVDKFMFLLVYYGKVLSYANQLKQNSNFFYSKNRYIPQK